jgi:PBP1b-binding outer membrane lipoprotein LpoB
MIRLAVLALTFALFAAGCSGSKNATPQQSASTGTAGRRHLTDLRDIGQLRTLFNTRSGEPRLILLASPT